MCRQFVQESFALCHEKEQENDNLKTPRMFLQPRNVVSTEDAETSVLGINHDVEPTVLINENYMLISYTYSTWTMKNLPLGSVC